VSLSIFLPIACGLLLLKIAEKLGNEFQNEWFGMKIALNVKYPNVYKKAYDIVLCEPCAYALKSCENCNRDGLDSVSDTC
jgi:hypothetical protein